jgi:hypothetical protein
MDVIVVNNDVEMRWMLSIVRRMEMDAVDCVEMRR